MFTRTDAEALVRDLQTRYVPSTAPGALVLVKKATRAEYCVGGAVCAALLPQEWTAAFPVARVLATQYQVLNPRLDWETALYYANHTMLFNDCGDFDRAWAVVIEALSDGETPIK